MCEDLYIEFYENNHNSPTRCGTLTSLGKMNDPKAVLPLINILKEEINKSRSCFSQAKYALINLKPHSTIPAIELLDDDDWQMRKHAVEILGSIKSADAVPGLIELLNDEHNLVRSAVAHTLKSFGPDSVEPLIQQLKRDDQMVKVHSVRILGKIKDQRAVTPLINALNDDNAAVRKAAVEALGRIGGQQSLNALMQAYQTETDPKAKDRLLHSLTRFHDPKTIPIFISSLDSEVSSIISLSIEELVRFESLSVVPLLDKLDNVPKKNQLIIWGIHFAGAISNYLIEFIAFSVKIIGLVYVR